MMTYFNILKQTYSSRDVISAKNLFLKKYDGVDIYEDQSCYICNNKNLDNIINKVDRYNFHYPTAICSECGNVQQAQYYKDYVLVDFYKNFYRKIYSHITPRDLFKNQKKRGNDIYNFLSSICVPKNVLEIGVGAGGILSAFKDKGCDVLGLDYDDKYLDIARENNISVINGSIEKLESQKFNLIILSHVLEHIVDPQSFLKNIIKHLDHNGVIYIEVPSLDNVNTVDYDYDLMLYFQNAHTIHYTKSSLMLLCKTVGLHNLVINNSIHSCWRYNKDNIKYLTKKDKQDCYRNTVALLDQIKSRRKIITKYPFNYLKPIKDFLVSIFN